jgi:hypothetical protein
MFAVLLAGGSGIFFYAKFAQAANFNFVQSTWVGGVDLITTASHYTDQSTWNKYNSSTGVTMGSTVQLTPAPFTFTDSGATSTTAAFTINGGSFVSGANTNTVSSSGHVILDVQQ